MFISWDDTRDLGSGYRGRGTVLRHLPARDRYFNPHIDGLVLFSNMDDDQLVVDAVSAAAQVDTSGEAMELATHHAISSSTLYLAVWPFDGLQSPDRPQPGDIVHLYFDHVVERLRMTLVSANWTLGMVSHG